jgi:hypothetical protein
MTEQVKIRTGLQALGNVSIAAFAALAVPPMVREKLSQQQMNQIVNGRVDLDQDGIKQLLSVIDTMQFLQETIRPKLPINWNDPLLVRDVLVETFKTRLDREDAIIVQAYYIMLSRTKWFERLRSDGSVIDTLNFHTEGAAFLDDSLAEKCARKLKELGVPCKVERMTAHRRQSTICTSLEQIGFVDRPEF